MLMRKPLSDGLIGVLVASPSLDRGIACFPLRLLHRCRRNFAEMDAAQELTMRCPRFAGRAGLPTPLGFPLWGAAFLPCERRHLVFANAHSRRRLSLCWAAGCQSRPALAGGFERRHLLGNRAGFG